MILVGVNSLLGPRTPPLEHEPASDHSYDPNLPEEEQEIYDIMRQMFKQCYQDDRTIQVNQKFVTFGLLVVSVH